MQEAENNSTFIAYKKNIAFTSLLVLGFRNLIVK
jgi:hypothetical protein